MVEAAAELQRLRAFVAATSPIVKAAIELRALGRTLEEIEEQMDRRRDADFGTRSATPWMIVKQGYDTALAEFDEVVKRAALGRFEDLLPTATILPLPKATAQPPAIPKEEEKG